MNPNTIIIYCISTQNSNLSNILTLIGSIIIPLLIYQLTAHFQKRLALHQKKYEFWLSFSKEYFILEPILKYMIKAKKSMIGVTSFQNKEEIQKIYNDWLNRWDKFYQLVEGNEKIYLEQEGISFLVLNSFFTALRNNIETMEIIENKGNIETTTISHNSISKIINDAKKIFEINVDINSETRKKYTNILDKYTEADKKKYKKEDTSKFTYEQMLKIVDELSDDAFLVFLENNLSDISDKLEKIVNIKSLFEKFCFSVKKYYLKIKPDSFDKWLKTK